MQTLEIHNIDDQEVLSTPMNNMAYKTLASDGLSQYLLVGEISSGKTSLANIWHYKPQAILVDSLDFSLVKKWIEQNVSAFLIEDIDKQEFDEEVLFYLINHCINEKKHLLITSSCKPSAIDIRADLISRIQQLPQLEILPIPPEQQEAWLAYLFASKQLKVKKEIIDYITKRIPRDYNSYHKIVTLIDSQSLFHKRNVTLPFVKSVLDDF